MSQDFDFGGEVSNDRAVRRFVTFYADGIMKFTEEVLYVAGSYPVEDYLTTVTMGTSDQVDSIFDHLDSTFQRKFDRNRWFSALYSG
jgi:hypothetical protein